MSRWVALALVFCAGLVAVSPAFAHPGGHGVVVGESLHLFVRPETGERLPGTLLFVADGQARIEDVAGRVHVWPLASMDRADRAFAEDFRARVERLNGVRLRVPAPLPTPPAVWLMLAAALTGLLIVTRTRMRSTLIRVPCMLIAIALPLACGGSTASPTTPTDTTTTNTTTPTTPTSSTAFTFPQATFFTSFSSHVKTRQDSTNLYVESDGLADNLLMVGIKSWQQQVPLPQPYTGTNAYTIPLTARLSDTPISARTALFNGAIALAANGIPIFNALNNRGEDSFLIGELDDFGGHCGRADDYHYHAAPLFLSTTVGATRPIGVALDGFPIYGSVEPDGSAVRALDTFNGHADTATVYHYHGTKTYPYINGGMKGVVTVVSDHVDPQPVLQPVRPAGTPLNGATITGFASTGANAWRLQYQVTGQTYRIDYSISGNRYTFVFTDPSGATRTETYTR